MILTVKDIAATLRDSKKNNVPVVVFTGAGCSKSAGIPLAFDLIKAINKKFKNNLKDLTEEQKKDYGECMAKLVPHEQKILLKKYIENAKINWAHIALASLLKNGYISKVLTFNFDNILVRACSLDNFYPSVYDLKILDQDYFSAIPNKSIIHLHGQWSGFELANGNKDTEQQAEKLKNYIKDTLNSGPSVFIGYSGNADPFFRLVQENFIGQHRLFWIDYSKQPNLNVSNFININPNHRNFIGEQDADQFLIELATELKCFPTSIFKDPIQHLKGICEYINEFPLTNKDTQFDLLEDIKMTLKIADQSKPAITNIKLIENLYHGKFDYIIKLAKYKSIDLNIRQTSKLVAIAHLEKSIELLNKNNNQYEVFFENAIEIEPKFYQLYGRYAEALINLYLKSESKQEENSGSRQYLNKGIKVFEMAFNIKPDMKDATIIGNYGISLSILAELEQDENFFTQSIKQFKKALAIQSDFTLHICNYGNTLAQFGRLKGDENIINEAIEQYKKALIIEPNEPNFLRNYAHALVELYKLKMDKSIFNQIMQQYKQVIDIQPNDPDIIGEYARALADIGTLNKDKMLFMQSFEQYEKALIIQPDHVINIRNQKFHLLKMEQLKLK
ncbi:MAG: hypothetical protein EOO69_09240 [Moraxellaceae bacterium]|nr:MAG: hypothetical protein EOO69_09240 [Moraxellaceae bacterium]